MQQRWEAAEEKLEASGIIRSNLEKEVEALRRNVHELNTKLAIANNARLSPEQLNDIQLVILKRIDALDRMIEASEHAIIEYSDEPGDIAFRNAVRDRKAAKEERDRLWKLSTSLDEM